MVESVGTIIAVALMIWIGRQRPGWRLMAASVLVGAAIVYELKNVAGSAQALVLLGLLAGVLGGAVLKRPWGLAALAVLVCATITPAVTRAISFEIAGAGLPPDFHVSTLTLASLSGLTLLAMEARSRSLTFRGLERQIDVSRRVWDAAGNGMVVVDLQWRVLDWNPAMERLTGITRRGAIGAILTDCAGFDAGTSHPECLRIAAQGVEIAAEHGQSPFGGYYSPIRSASGQVTGVIAMIVAGVSDRTTPASEHSVEVEVA